MTTTSKPLPLALVAPPPLNRRPCILKEPEHVYIWEPTGEQMRTSVTAVINHGKPPYDGPPEAAWRGTHIHLWLNHHLTGQAEISPVSPEGIDCTDWIEHLRAMSLWSECFVIASEFTLVNRRKSLGGQLDLLIQHERWGTCLLDLKTRSSSYKHKSIPKADRHGYMAQAGGYLELLQSGDHAIRCGAPWVDQCRTLVAMPHREPLISEPYKPNSCSLIWDECWQKYSDSLKTTF
nr:DNA replication factor Dna2-like nuclease [uncultured Mediterranean phage uvMED]